MTNLSSPSTALICVHSSVPGYNSKELWTVPGWILLSNEVYPELQTLGYFSRMGHYLFNFALEWSENWEPCFRWNAVFSLPIPIHFQGHMSKVGKPITKFLKRLKTLTHLSCVGPAIDQANFGNPSHFIYWLGFEQLRSPQNSTSLEQMVSFSSKGSHKD